MTFGLLHHFRARLDFPGRVLALAAITLAALLVATSALDAAEAPGEDGYVELDVKSDYSHIRIYRRRSVRSMVFVRDSGEEALETQLDLHKPHELQFAYLRHMFLSYLFRPKQEKVLIVGLGGGSMVHFLKRYDPNVHIDAVEIDPVVVSIAEKYFGIRSEGKVKVVTADGLEYLTKTKSQYDVIYMDAFLKPSRDTDSTGVPLRLRTARFYQSVQKKLKTAGLVVFNLNPHPNIHDDVSTIRKAFPQIYVFPLPGSEGLVVVASMLPEREPLSAMRGKAKELDRRFGTSFSFQPMVRRVGR